MSQLLAEVATKQTALGVNRLSDYSRAYLKGLNAATSRPPAMRQDSSREAMQLLKSAIASVNKEVAFVVSARAEKDAVVGTFSDRRKRLFSFRIKDDGTFTYRQSSRTDAEKDQCKQGTPCGFTCISPADDCGGRIQRSEQEKVAKAKKLLTTAKSFSESASAADRTAGKLIMKVFESESLPSKREILSLLGKSSSEAIAGAKLRDPMAGVRRNVEREAIVKEALELATDRDLTGKGMAIEAAKSILANEELHVNTAGFFASKAGAAAGAVVGGAIAGPLGAAAGGYVAERAADYAGAAVTRSIKTASKIHKKALEKLNEDEAFSAMDDLEKAKTLKSQKISEYETMAEEIESNKIQDAAGWAIGNTFADLTGTFVNVPFRGALAALEIVPEIEKARQKVKKGEGIGKASKDAAKAIVTKPIRQLRAIATWESKERKRASRQIRALKDAVGEGSIARLTKNIKKELED